MIDDRMEIMMASTTYVKGYHVEELRYYYSEEHSLLGSEGIQGVSTQNIGAMGQNLTIAILSMNRASLTIRLMNSIKKYIPEFAGEFLIGDNGSDEVEREKLYKKMREMPYRCRMIEFGKNFGVSGGRNRLFKEVQTDWILSMDNDLYFVGNPLKKLQKDIAILGCHFMALPLVDKSNHEMRMFHGHLYLENLVNKVGIGGSFAYLSETAALNQDNQPFLCTFLPGGAAVINKKSFFQVGAFEENMFVGFEDTEFSVRLFQKGFKIGGSGVACMIHDHPKPEIGADIDYEKKRFSTNKLKESGQYFEKKHGFSVWNFSSEEWVNKRLQELTGEEYKCENTLETNEKIKIALFLDRPGWALENIANQIIKNLSDEFEFKKIYQDPIDCLAAVFLMAKDCDLIHFLWRPLSTAFDDEYTKQFINNLRMSEQEFKEKYVNSKVVSVGVYDHFFLDGKDKEISYKMFSDPESVVNCYTVSSELLNEIYLADEEIKRKPNAVIQDGVDCTLFQPLNTERFQKLKNRTIRLGWVGNSRWQVGNTLIKDLKGIHTIIKPVVKELQEEGYDVILYTSDRNEKMIPHNQMPEFYSMIDIYICASAHEGTPNPILEAMACGVPIITTDVGIVKEVFGPMQRTCILKERSKEALKDKLKYILDNLDYLQELSNENLDYIKKWDWTVMCEKFRTYFREMIQCQRRENFGEKGI